MGMGVSLSAPVEKSVATPASTVPIATSYTAAASPLLSLGHAIAPVISPLTYSAPLTTNLVHTYAAPSVYRIPTPVVYRAPAPAPIVVEAPPKVIVKTVEVPAPAPEPIIKTVYVEETSGESDEEEKPTVYTAVETTDDDSVEDDK